LNSKLEEEVYVVQPQGFEVDNHKDKVYRLRKALYGLKQAPRAWNQRIDGFMGRLGFEKCTSEHGVYVKERNKDGKTGKLIVCLYVDDLLVTGSSEKLIAEFKAEMISEFEMSDLGRLSYFLGIKFSENEYGIVMHQSRYAQEILRKFDMHKSNPAITPAEVGLRLEKEPEEAMVDPTEFRKIVGSLRYICCTRPDLCFSVRLISRYMQSPRQSHLNAAKRIMRYLQGTCDFGILIPKGNPDTDMKVTAYSYADWCGDKDDRKSTVGSIFFLEKSPISWRSSKEQVVALSSCEAEYVAACEATCQAVWWNSLIEELKVRLLEKINLFVDNKSAIDLANHPASHGRSKHIETKYHFIRDQVSKKKVEIAHCRSEMQLSDILTKALKREHFKELRRLIGVINVNEFLT